MAQETKKITDLTALSELTASTLFVTHDGVGARKATMQQIWDFIPSLGKGPGAHNGIYRGKSLGSSVTEAQYDTIGTGEFNDLYIGDYWTISGTRYVIVAFDYYFHCGDGTNGSITYPHPTLGDVTIPVTGDVAKHHVTIMPDTTMYNSVSMNPTNTTEGGYASTVMYRGPAVYTAPANTTYYSNTTLTTEAGTLAEATTITKVNDTYGKFTSEEVEYYVAMTDCTTSYDITNSGLYRAKNAIITAFTAFGVTHLLGHRKYLVNACTDGVPSGGAWFDSFCELPTEENVYGSCIYGAMNSNNVFHTKATIDKTRFPLFGFRPDMIIGSGRKGYWLQDVVNFERFALVASYGYARDSYASDSRSGNGVRPVFSIVKS